MKTLKTLRIFAVYCFFSIMILGILFANEKDKGLIVENTEVDCGAYAHYVTSDYFFGYYDADEIIHIYEYVWGGSKFIWVATLPAKYRVYHDKLANERENEPESRGHRERRITERCWKHIFITSSKSVH